MSESQRKIIGLIVLATGFSFLQVMGLTAELAEPKNAPCPRGSVCRTASASIETAYGSFDAWEMSQDEFDRYRIEFIIFTFVAQLIPAFMIIKMAREREMQRKRDSSVGTPPLARGGGMGTPLE